MKSQSHISGTVVQWVDFHRGTMSRVDDDNDNNNNRRRRKLTVHNDTKQKNFWGPAQM